jgi:hypothetical protein
MTISAPYGGNGNTDWSDKVLTRCNHFHSYNARIFITFVTKNLDKDKFATLHVISQKDYDELIRSTIISITIIPSLVN